MGKKSFLLVSLKEDKAKELAQVISNDSCRKILDYLSEKEDATETDLSKKLGIPISTVHYNLQQLMKAGIIAADEYHYSEKGKEVNHYKLANKYIIIAPKTTHGIKEKLRSILPLGILSAAGALAIQLYGMFSRKAVFGAMQAPAMEKAADKVAEPLMEEAVAEGARAVAEKTPEVVTGVVQAQPNYALWFLLGCIFVMVFIIVFDFSFLL